MADCKECVVLRMQLNQQAVEIQRLGEIVVDRNEAIGVLQAEIERLTAERDEAREEVEQLQIKLVTKEAPKHVWNKLTERFSAVCKERDELSKQLADVYRDIAGR